MGLDLPHRVDHTFLLLLFVAFLGFPLLRSPFAPTRPYVVAGQIVAIGMHTNPQLPRASRPSRNIPRQPALHLLPLPWISSLSFDVLLSRRRSCFAPTCCNDLQSRGVDTTVFAHGLVSNLRHRSLGSPRISERVHLLETSERKTSDRIRSDHMPLATSDGEGSILSNPRSPRFTPFCSGLSTPLKGKDHVQWARSNTVEADRGDRSKSLDGYGWSCSDSAILGDSNERLHSSTRRVAPTKDAAASARNTSRSRVAVASPVEKGRLARMSVLSESQATRLKLINQFLAKADGKDKLCATIQVRSSKRVEKTECRTRYCTQRSFDRDRDLNGTSTRKRLVGIQMLTTWGLP